jgi:hypothetical protein
MKLSDQEQVILKAIERVGRNGLALISEVIRAVGYPKATVKKVLVRLSEKGAVSLHRHDWPRSLKPEQRKLLVRIGRDYFTAVSMRKKNPAKQSKSKAALKTAGKAVKGFAQGTLSAASQILGAGATALNPHGMSEKAWKAEENKYRKSIANYRAKGWTLKQIKDRLWLTYGLTLQSLSDDKAVFVDPFHRGGGFTLDLSAPKRGRKVPNPYLGYGRRVRFISGEYKGRTGVIQSAIQKRYDKSPTVYRIQIDGFPKPGGWSGKVTAEAHQLELVTENPVRRKIKNKYIDLVIKGQAKKTPRGWQVGKKTFAQGRGTVNVSSGYYLDRHTGMVYAKRERNAVKRRRRNRDYPYWKVYHIDTKKSPPYDKTFLGSSSFGMDKKEAIEKFRRSHYPGRLRAGTKIVAEKGVITTKNPKRRRNSDKKDSDHPIEVTKHWRAGPPGYLTPWQRAHHAGQSQLFETGIKPAKKRNPKGKKRARKNPSAESIRKKFAGRVTGERDVFVPSSTPKGKLAKLGNLVLIQTEQGTIKPVRGSAVLLADTRGKLHIGTTSKSNLFNGPKQSFGQVKRIEYDSSKPHLGYPSPIIWHHKLGEETGERPTLYADGQGGLVFRGGRYRLTRRGIEN